MVNIPDSKLILFIDHENNILIQRVKNNFLTCFYIYIYRMLKKFLLYESLTWVIYFYFYIRYSIINSEMYNNVSCSYFLDIYFLIYKKEKHKQTNRINKIKIRKLSNNF